MPREIEKKFLVKGSPWFEAPSQKIRQAYIAKGTATVRIRISNNQAWLTIKGKAPEGSFSRLECEYSIPVNEAEIMITQLALEPPIEKTRYTLEYEGFEWTIDVFEGANKGLVLAEIELESEDVQFTVPEWAFQDVTFDHRFANSALISHPWSNFSSEFE